MKAEMGGGRYEYENKTLILILGELKNIDCHLPCPLTHQPSPLWHIFLFVIGDDFNYSYIILLARREQLATVVMAGAVMMIL